MICSLKSKIRGRGCWSLRLRCLGPVLSRFFPREKNSVRARARALSVAAARTRTPVTTNSPGPHACGGKAIPARGFSHAADDIFFAGPGGLSHRVESSLDTQGTDRALSCPSPPHSSLYCPTSGFRMHHDALMHTRASGCEGTNAQRVAPSKVPPRRLHALRMFEGVLPRPRRQAV